MVLLSGKRQRSFARLFLTNRFLSLLVFFFALFMVTPFLDDSMFYGHIADIFYMLGLMAALRCIKNTRAYYIGIGLALSVLAISFIEMFTNWTFLYLPTLVLALSVIGLSIFEISRFLIAKQKVDMDTVMGGICVYLLIGFFWTEVFVALELINPGSFDFTVHAAPDFITKYLLINYYSFMTLLTVGYGDIIPMSMFAQTSAVMEGLMGQLYIVVFMARLVSMAVIYWQDSGEE